MRREDFFASLENIDVNYIDEAEHYQGSKLNNPLFMYIGMAATVLVVAGCAVLFFLMNNREDASVETTVETKTVTERIINGTGASDVTKETFNDTDDRIRMLHKNNVEIPDGTVAVLMFLSEAEHLEGFEGWYAPEDQEDWKAAVNRAVARVQDKEYQVYPYDDMMPVRFYWKHDGVEDSWTLAKDGSLWGQRYTIGSAGDDMFKNNYIAPGDAAELAAKIRKVCDFFGVDPIAPEQIGEIKLAELTVKGKTYRLEDSVKLGYLGNTIKNAKKHMPSGCPWATLRLTFADGNMVTVALASDGCNIWQSDGVYYKYGNREDAEKMFALFGINLAKLYA